MLENLRNTLAVSDRQLVQMNSLKYKFISQYKKIICYHFEGIQQRLIDELNILFRSERVYGLRNKEQHESQISIT